MLKEAVRKTNSFLPPWVDEHEMVLKFIKFRCKMHKTLRSKWKLCTHKSWNMHASWTKETGQHRYWPRAITLYVYSSGPTCFCKVAVLIVECSVWLHYPLLPPLYLHNKPTALNKTADCARDTSVLEQQASKVYIKNTQQVSIIYIFFKL